MYFHEEVEQLRELYLEDLRKTVQYDDKPPRSRIRYPQQYANIPITLGTPIHNYKDVWCISDYHFRHKNILSYCNRPFDNVEEMEQKLIELYNERVKPNDLCIWGGDVSFAGAETTNPILKQMNGDKILVIGNHDMNKKKVKNLDFMEKHLVYAIDDTLAPLLFTHFPMDNIPLPWVNVHGHTHNTPVANPHERHINICCEMIEFKPIHLEDVQRQARTIITSMESTK